MTFPDIEDLDICVDWAVVNTIRGGKNRFLETRFLCFVSLKVLTFLLLMLLQKRNQSINQVIQSKGPVARSPLKT